VIPRKIFSFFYYTFRSCRKLDSVARSILYRLPFLKHVYHRWFLELRLPNEDLILSWDSQKILVKNPRHSVIGRDIFFKGTWEPQATRYISPRIMPGMTVLDIGAGIGYYTLLFAKRVGIQGRVIAFEPIPSVREKLEYNVRLNGYTNVTVCDFALFSSHGSAILEAPFFIMQVDPTHSANEGRGIKIQTKIFDECVERLRIQRIDLVKIDVEGAELDVLRGMQQSLIEHHPVLLIEVHPNYLGRFNYDPGDLLHFLETMEYDVRPVDKRSLNFKKGNITIYCS